MNRSKKILALVVYLVVVSVAGMVIGQGQRGQRNQGAPGAQGDQPGQRGQGGRGNFDPAQMQQMMLDRLAEALGADETAMKILGPRLTKVMELSRNSSGMGRMIGGMMGRAGRGGPGGTRGGQPATPLTGTPLLEEKLQTIVDQPNANPAELKAAITALRAAREKDKAALAAAQQQLREVLTLRQECILYLRGLLD